MRVVVLRSTGPQNNPKHFTPEFCARLQAADPVAFSTDVLGEFADAETGINSPVAIRRSTRETPLEIAPERGAVYSSAVDVGRGRWTLVLVERCRVPEREPERFRVVLARELLASDPETAWAEIARVLAAYRVTEASVDQYAAGESASIARRHGLYLRERPWNEANRLDAFQRVADLIAAGRLELSPERTLRRDLLSVKKRAKQSGGYSIHLPTTSDGRHCDFAPALAAAIAAAGKVMRDEDACLISIKTERQATMGADPCTRVTVWGHRSGLSSMSSDERRRAFLDDDRRFTRKEGFRYR